MEDDLPGVLRESPGERRTPGLRTVTWARGWWPRWLVEVVVDISRRLARFRVLGLSRPGRVTDLPCSQRTFLVVHSQVHLLSLARSRRKRKWGEQYYKVSVIKKKHLEMGGKGALE